MNHPVRFCAGKERVPVPWPLAEARNCVCLTLDRCLGLDGSCPGGSPSRRLWKGSQLPVATILGPIRSDGVLRL